MSHPTGSAWQIVRDHIKGIERKATDARRVSLEIDRAKKICVAPKRLHADAGDASALLLFRGVESAQFRGVSEDLPLRFASFGFAPLGGIRGKDRFDAGDVLSNRRARDQLTKNFQGNIL